MTLKRLVWAGGSTALAVAAMAAGALGAHRSGAGLAFSYVVHNTGVEYVTSAGRTSSFPGRLDTGDQIFARDTLSQGGTRIGYVRRLQHPDDRRSVIVESTAALEPLEAEMFAQLAARMKKLLANYRGDELATIKHFLENAAEITATSGRP